MSIRRIHLSLLFLSFGLFIFPSAMLASTSVSEINEIFTDTWTDQFVSSVATAGDVNGDGYDDMLIGVKQDDSAVTDAGAVYVLYGSSEQLTSASLEAAVLFTGEEGNDQAGVSVASAGDVNGDGYDDILVGAQRAEHAGSAYLIYGQADPLVSGSLSSAVQFIGEASNDGAGCLVASAGDVNGDGYDDILINAYGNDDPVRNAGTTYLIYGQADPLVSASLSSAVKFWGEEENDFARNMASAGDVNGDGYDDIIIGSAGNDDGGSEGAGAAYLIYGQADPLVSTSLSAVVQLDGANSESAGYPVASAGDVNGDGYDDMLIGAYSNNQVETSAGAAYLVYGQAEEFSSHALSEHVQFTGESAIDNAGISVASAGDVNGDGYDDMLIGAWRDDEIGVDSGAMYLLFGQEENHTSVSLSSAMKFTGALAGDLFGYSVASAGDVNGDGYDDIALLSQRSNSGPVYVGYVYIDADLDGLPGSDGLLAGLDENDNDADNDSVETEEDCNDQDADVDHAIEYYADVDGDLLGAVESMTSECVSTAPTGYVSNSLDTNDSIPDPDNMNEVVGDVNGNMTVTFSDLSTATYPVFAISSTKTTKVLQYQDTAYILVLHPNGKKIALVNPYTGEVLKRIVLSKKIKYTKNAFKTLDVRNDGSVDIIVTSKKKGKVKVSLLTLNTSTSTLKKKDSILLAGEKKVVVTKTKAPKKVIKLRNKNGKTQATLKVNSSYQMSNKPE